MNYTSKILMDRQSLQNFGTMNNLTSQEQYNPLFSTILGELFRQQQAYHQKVDSFHYQGQHAVYLPNGLPAALVSKARTSAFSMKDAESIPFQSTVKQDSPTTEHTPFSDIIKEAAQQHHVPEKLIASIIKHESNFNPTAHSHAGASGLMQLMPGTAKYLGVKNRLDPKDNIFGGTKYLKQMLTQFDNDIPLALAAYNAGPGNVKKFGGVPPFKETHNYINKVMNTYTS